MGEADEQIKDKASNSAGPFTFKDETLADRLVNHWDLHRAVPVVLKHIAEPGELTLIFVPAMCDIHNVFDSLGDLERLVNLRRNNDRVRQ